MKNKVDEINLLSSIKMSDWNDDKDNFLLGKLEDGKTHEEIATLMKKSLPDIKDRIKYLAKLFLDDGNDVVDILHTFRLTKNEFESMFPKPAKQRLVLKTPIVVDENAPKKEEVVEKTVKKKTTKKAEELKKVIEDDDEEEIRKPEDTSGQPSSRQGKRWIQEEEKVLLSMLNDKKPIITIHEKMGRSIYSLNCRIKGIAARMHKEGVDKNVIMETLNLTDEGYEEALKEFENRPAGKPAEKDEPKVSRGKKEVTSLDEVLTLLKSIDKRLKVIETKLG
jgi:hypothetical protein